MFFGEGTSAMAHSIDLPSTSTAIEKSAIETPHLDEAIKGDDFGPNMDSDIMGM